MDVLIDYLFDSIDSKGQTTGFYESQNKAHSLRFVANEAELTLILSEDKMCISRNGPLCYQLSLTLGKTYLVTLQTPLGNIECQAALHKLEYDIEGGAGNIDVEYTLGLPGEALPHRMQLCLSKKK